MYGSLERKSSVEVIAVPSDAEVSDGGFLYWNPVSAGSLCCGYRSSKIIEAAEFICADDYRGDVTIYGDAESPDGQRFESSVRFTCQ